MVNVAWFCMNKERYPKETNLSFWNLKKKKRFQNMRNVPLGQTRGVRYYLVTQFVSDGGNSRCYLRSTWTCPLSDFCSLCALPTSIIIRLAIPKHVPLLVPFSISSWTCCLWTCLVPYEPASSVCLLWQLFQKSTNAFFNQSCSPVAFIECPLVYTLEKLFS